MDKPDSIVRKMKELLNFENLLLPGSNDEYYKKEWEKIKNAIDGMSDESHICDVAKIIDEQIDKILEYIAGAADGVALSSFFGFYRNGFAYDARNLQCAVIAPPAITPLAIVSINDLLTTTKPFERTDITYNNDFVESLAHHYNLPCKTFDEFLAHTNYHVTIINATNSTHVNYFLQSFGTINDATMIDSILHMRRKRPTHELTTIPAIEAHSKLINAQKNNYNRLFGLSDEKNSNPLKNYKKSMDELQNIPALPAIVNEFTLQKNNLFIKKHITLFVTKYSLFLSNNFHKIKNEPSFKWE
jgi:hypothetical protein